MCANKPLSSQGEALRRIADEVIAKIDTKYVCLEAGQVLLISPREDLIPIYTEAGVIFGYRVIGKARPFTGKGES